MKTNGAIVKLFVVVVALTGGCLQATAPSQPSWDEDVYPIIRGSCSHCHGETVGQRMQPLLRYDICDPMPFTAAMVTGGINGLLSGALMGSSLFEGYLTPGSTSEVLPQMPPPPGSPLSSYEKDVVRNWVNNVPKEAKCVKKGANREPSVRLVSDPQDSPNGLQLQLEVTDPDGDTVLGQAAVGMSSAPIPATGRRWVTIPGARRGDRVTVRVHDGFIQAAKEFTF